MAGSSTVPRATGLGDTNRSNSWLIENIPVIVVLSAFGLYATLRAFEGKFYEWGPYLSPFYSPLIDPHHHWWPFSPAILILGGPLGFRLTCYYYRKAYYRAFFFDPRGCAVPESRKHGYRGETAFPFVLQNVHRYFFYLSLLFLAFLWSDVVRAFFFPEGFGIGLGTLVMFVNILLLTTYTFSCHSLRHIVGGKLDCFSCTTFGPPRHTAWRWVSVINERHMLWAWTSLFSVGLTDLYIRLASSGAIKDIRLL